MLTVCYSCQACGIAEAQVTVPFRPEEDTENWVREIVVPALNADHARRSPGCKADNLVYSTSPKQRGQFT